MGKMQEHFHVFMKKVPSGHYDSFVTSSGSCTTTSSNRFHFDFQGILLIK